MSPGRIPKMSIARPGTKPPECCALLETESVGGVRRPGSVGGLTGREEAGLAGLWPYPYSRFFG